MRALFGVYLDDYFASFAQSSWGDLVSRQAGLYASLAFGAAGIAYAHWYAGYLQGDETLLEGAERWIGAALAGQRRHHAFLGPGAPRAARMPAGAYLYGPCGLSFVRALVARSCGDRRAERRALARFAELARTGACGETELYRGSAGGLAAAAILFEHLGEEMLFDLGTELSATLCRRAVAHGSGPVTWNGLQGPGLAHGAAGPCLALLLWSAAAGSALPSWFAPSLLALLETAAHPPERLPPLPAEDARLCTGLTGPAFLAARAAQILRDASLLALARSLAASVLAHLPAHADLCCGRAGCAFTFLALAREDPAGPWRQRAQDLALSTLLCDRDDWVLAGLYGGEAALPCLALNMVLGIDSGPPCLDFIPRLSR